jgi:hypothetical protein
LQNKTNSSTEQGLLTGKLLHLALPVRWSRVGEEGRGPAEIACTYDIHPQGARLLSGRDVNVGDVVLVERGRAKAMCRVIWCADPASPLRGQFTVQCMEGRTPWDEELRQLGEQYQPLIYEGAPLSRLAATDPNRRRRPRFYAEGQAEMMDGAQRVAGEVEQISEYGARLALMTELAPGTHFRLMLNMFDVSVSLKAQVKYLAQNLGMGVEFQQIRRGDRPLLAYVLEKLKGRRVEDFARVEVVTESMVQTG